MDGKCNFWGSEPRDLIRSYELFPNKEMDIAELLNALTRLIIIIALVLFLTGFANWWIFLLVGIAITLVMWYLSRDQEKNEITKVEYYTPTCGGKKPKIEHPKPVEIIYIPRYSGRR